MRREAREVEGRFNYRWTGLTVCARSVRASRLDRLQSYALMLTCVIELTQATNLDQR